MYEGSIVDRRPPEREAQIDYNDVESEDDGYTANVDQDYDIGPANYCFVRTPTFGAPVLSAVLLPPQQNVTIIERTTNVTNIYYNREPNNVFVYNGGPSYNFISAHSDQPIQRLQIERVQNTSYLEEGLRAGGNPTQVRGGILQVAAPMISRHPVNFAQVKPAHVKQTLEQPQVVHGWSNTGANPAVVQQLHNRFKEQAQQAPARAVAPKERVVEPLPPAQRVVTRAPAPVPANAPGAAKGQPNRDLSPEAIAARRAQRQQERTGQPEQPGQPAAQPGRPAQAGQPKPGAPGQPLSEEDRIARRNAAQQARDSRTKGQTNGQPAAPAQAGSAPGPAPQAAQPKDKSPEAVAARRAQRQQEHGAKAPEPAAQTEARPAPAEAQPAAAQPKDNSDEAKAARRAQRQQERAAQPSAQPAQAQPASPQADEERDARRAQRQQERAQPAEQPKANPERNNAPAPRPQAQPEPAKPEKEARQAQRPPAEQGQAQQERAQQERAARQAQRQQERAAQPQAPAQQGKPQGEAQRAEHQGDKGDKEKPGDKPNQ